MEELLRIVAPHFVAGLVLCEGRCTRTAPILAWGLGKARAELVDYFERRGWLVEVVPPGEAVERKQGAAMKCLLCGSEDLKAHVTLTYEAPLALRMGTIKVGGLKVTQLDLKEAWDKQKIRGPIFCYECGTEHYYCVGEADPLCVGSAKQAREG